MAPKKRLIRYIEKYLGEYEEEQIRNRLIKDGWNEDNINSAIDFVKEKMSKKKGRNEQKKKAKKSEPEISKKKKAKKESDKGAKEQRTRAHETRQWKGIKNRSPAGVLILSLITGGIFFIIWLVITTKELRNNSKTAPNPYWLFILLLPLASAIMTTTLLGGTPDISQLESNMWIGILALVLNLITGIVMLIYYWKYSEAINEISDFSSVGLFLLFVFIWPVAQVISQVKLNTKAENKPKKEEKKDEDKKKEKGEKSKKDKKSENKKKASKKKSKKKE